jgi:hypothetical protein
MINLVYRLNGELLEKEFATADEASTFMAENDIVKFHFDKLAESTSIIATPDIIKNAMDSFVLEDISREAISESKKYDHPHGKKLSHQTLDHFFKNEAPKYETLAAVEHALSALYKKNSVEFTPAVIKQVISSYKKRADMTESELMEVSLSSDEKKEKDKIVLKLRKNLKEFRRRFKDETEANLQNLATTVVKYGK